MDYGQRLDEWNAVKKGIDSSETRQSVQAKRIYWTKIGQNIGKEVFGKGATFARPVLVINVLFNDTFLGVPLSSKTQGKKGKFYHKFIDSKGNEQLALLGQVRIFDIKRIGAYLSKIEGKDFVKIKEKIKGEIVK